MKIVGGAPSFVLDTVSIPETQAAAYELLAPGGKLVVILPPSVKETTDGRTVTALETGVRLQQDPQFAEALFKAVTNLLESGDFKVINPIVRLQPLLTSSIDSAPQYPSCSWRSGWDCLWPGEVEEQSGQRGEADCPSSGHGVKLRVD